MQRANSILALSIAVLVTSACSGDEPDGSPGAGGATSSGTASGGGGVGGAGTTTGTGGTGTGGASTSCAGNPAGALLFTTLDDAASISSPVAGSGLGAGHVTTPANDFIAALTGNGIRIDGPNEYVRFQETAAGPNFSHVRGTLDFCYQPTYLPTDGANHHLFGTSGFSATGGMRVRKAASNNANRFQVIILDDNSQFAGGETAILPGNVPFVPGVWVRVTVSWDLMVAAGQQNTRVYFDGVEPPYDTTAIGPASMPAASASEFVYVGAWDAVDSETASGVLDELKLYGQPLVP